MPLTTLDRVLQWTKKDDFAPERNAELIRCIAAASRMLTRITGRQLERVTRSISLDGYAAVGVFDDVLYLPVGDRPVLHTRLKASSVPDWPSGEVAAMHRAFHI